MSQILLTIKNSDEILIDNISEKKRKEKETGIYDKWALLVTSVVIVESSMLQKYYSLFIYLFVVVKVYKYSHN